MQLIYQEGLMQRSVLVLLAAVMTMLPMGCGDDNYLESLSNDDSAAACQYQVTMDLDSGNYDAVIASTCANYMDLAAAYLGKAGFEIINIINVMIDSNDSGGNEMEAFIGELVGSVSQSDMRSLDSSLEYYSLVNAANGYSPDLVLDAQFLKSALVAPTKSFTFIKSAIDPDGDGKISECDMNGNSVPDEVDATGCALTLAGGATDCASMGITVDDTTYISLSFTGYSSLYNGLEMDLGVANAACPDDIYYKLLFNSSSVAVTSLEKCIDPAFPLIEWNCPYEDIGGTPEDMLEVFNTAIINSIDTLKSLGIEEDSEVYAAINSVAVDACGGIGSGCTEEDLRLYLESQMGL
jgi:hypothetical protein